MSKHTEFPVKPDYEAKYKALEQAVKDAVTEIKVYEGKERINYQSSEDRYNIGTGMGYLKAIEILTEKTGISA